MARKNEAKITFRAETEEFDSSIRGSKAEIGRLSGELDKNSRSLKGNDGDAELLAQRVDLLSRKEKEQASVVENLRRKVDAAKNAYGENSDEVRKLEGQLGRAEASLMGTAEALDRAKSRLSLAESAYGQLTSEIRRQESEVRRLQTAYANAVLEKGQDSAEARQLEARIGSLNDELRQNKGRMEQAEQAARELAEGYRSAERQAQDLASVSDIAVGTAVADIATSAASSLAQLDEATQEHRVNMNALRVAYEHSGRSVEEATEVYRGFLEIAGDSDQAVEATLDMRNLADAGADLSAWYDIASGASAAFKDALPVENLIESANETVRCGQVTGGLADALNWTAISQEALNAEMSGYPAVMAAYNEAVSEGASNEDAINAALAACGDEQERVALLTAALSGQYGEMGREFQEANSAVSASRIASDELAQAQSELADRITPVQAAATSLAADGIGLLADNLGWIVPIVGVAAAAFSTLWIAANGSAALAALKAGIAGVGAAFSGISAPILIAIAAITAIAGAIVYLWNTNEGFRNTVTTAWQGMQSAIQSVCAALMPIVQPIFEQMAAFLDGIMNGTIAPIISGALSIISGLFQTVCGIIAAVTTGDFMTLSNGVSSIMSGLSSVLSGILNGIKSVFGSVFGGILSTVTGIFSSIYNTIESKIDSAKNTVQNAINSIKGFFSGLSLSFPRIRVPKLTVSGSFSINPPRVPSFNVSWRYLAKGGILTNPTLLGMAGNTGLVAGEAGPEAVLPIDRLQGFVDVAIRRNLSADGTDRIVAAVEKLADRVTVLEVNGRVLATATAGDADAVNGSRQMLVDRGLTL